MDPPTLSGRPTSFWNALQRDLQTSLDKNNMIVYFRAYGSANGVFPGHWRPVYWTLEDFAYFYDCPEKESAFAAYVDECVSKSKEDSNPTWWQVVDVMNELFTRPDLLVNYLGLRPADQIDKSNWRKVDHAVAFICRLLNYRDHLDSGTPTTRDDFQTRQAAYASSYGRNNPFYARWDSTDKWAAAFLLFCMLTSEREDYLRLRTISFLSKW
ncbi:uncharacterized protein GGS22DRAFT_192109 [Annulohypoxylon maeteangense]|uniref:uncharacterized protein n=1 Tax=Annulohypoxylon maeteangense TaxID=1927788 RepID=UPI0020087C4F|nr:uncharacterized protein GGS22DRAFT_192109 [Annulohypoxylon maeteangense]KAI0881475.1 hypothetical protein GGS22DRAFT_192109 [Annulohypoxylon maeteangense]